MTTVRQLATKEELIGAYNLLVGGIEEEAIEDEDRAYGGVIRAAKGKLVEEITTHIVRLAWQSCGGSDDRLSFGDVKTFRVPIQPAYVDRLSSELQAYIHDNMGEYFFRAKVDRHVFVDRVFVMGIECKSFTENAMLKRILIDFRLLKSLQPDLICCLLQLESQLGGDYSNLRADSHWGSPSSHTLMSYFPEVDLNIITLLQGERKIDRPIHQPNYFKELTSNALDGAINRFAQLLASFA